MQIARPSYHHGRFLCKSRRRGRRPLRLGIRNIRGTKLVEWCHTNNLIVGKHGFSNRKEGNEHGKAQVMEAKTRSITS